MGEHDIAAEIDDQRLQSFTKALLADLSALEFMLATDRIESGISRIGAEQEMFLVDKNLHPAPIAIELLQKANDKRLTTEIARFNLEANLTPQVLRANCFRAMQMELEELLAMARKAAKHFEAKVFLGGILPTLRQTDLSLDRMVPLPRYLRLNESVTKLRGGPFNIYIKGLDELHLTHDNIMMESCNTSFQVHLQVNPHDFAALYNMAQAITAPVLATAVNSPLLFGHRLWQETRLALFQHSADERSKTRMARSQPSRVGFGEKWLERSVIEMFHDEIARFRIIMVNEPDEDPMHVLARGETPLLSALRLHNGTIWPWNRACYGVTGGVAHLRIENRAFPAGPTTVDEIANAAFFIGLMLALPEEYGPISSRMSFDAAKNNFFAAARHGLTAQLIWIDDQRLSATRLIRDHLLPLARQGLKQQGVDGADIDQYLGIIEDRVNSGRTGSEWILKSWAALDGTYSREMRNRTLTSAILERQKSGKPVHQWPIFDPQEQHDWREGYQTVGQFMSTDLFTVRPDDLVDLAASVMDWRHIRHVPVEDENGNLVGLISHRGLLRLLTRRGAVEETQSVTVRQIMKRDPVTVQSSTPTLEAIEIMRREKVGCLPVVDDGLLVGIVTSFDFLEASGRLFKEYLVPAEVTNQKKRATAHGRSNS